MQQVLDNLKYLPSGSGAKDIDLIFLRGIMESPIVLSLAKVNKHHTHSCNPICCPSNNLCQQTQKVMSSICSVRLSSQKSLVFSNISHPLSQNNEDVSMKNEWFTWQKYHLNADYGNKGELLSSFLTNSHSCFAYNYKNMAFLCRFWTEQQNHLKPNCFVCSSVSCDTQVAPRVLNWVPRNVRQCWEITAC